MNPLISMSGLSSLQDLDVENVCVFMADALRWDYLPDSVRERGLTIKTVAASLTTHTSVPTMLTGLWPKRHGVLSWQHQIPDVNHLLSLTDYSCGYYMPGDEDVLDDGTFAILDLDERRELSTLAPPYVYFERHHGGHAPFEAAGWDGTWDEFEAAFAGDTEKHRHWYQHAVDGTVADFEDRLATLEDRGQLDDTLVVFTSDHGEYLGEDGLVDHTSPVRPEGVYVPTVFVHPDIEGGQRAPGVMRHVDLFPTILNALGETPPSFVDGVDLAQENPERGYSLATANVYAFDAPRRVFEAASVWDADGGHVLNRTGLPRRLLATVGLFAGTDWKSKHLRRTPTESIAAARHYLASTEVFGNPAFDRTTAEEVIDDVERKEPVTTGDTEALSNETKEQLKELGYL